MTLANRLTVSRIFLAGVFLAFMLSDRLWARSLALGIFILATATDWLDGWLARRTKTTSAFGALADPLADKLLVLAALAVFLKIRELDIPSWVLFLIVAREFIIVTLRSLAAVHGTALAADRYGKWKMGVQTGAIVAILGLLVFETYLQETPGFWGPPRDKDRLLVLLQPVPRLLSYLMLLATWASGLVYLRRNWGMIRRSWDPKTWKKKEPGSPTRVEDS